MFCLGYKTLLITKFACFRRCLKLCSTDYTDFLSLRDVLFLSRNARNSIAFSSRTVGSRKILFIFCLFPTDNTDFFALLKILATLGNLSKLNCPRLSQDFSDFLPSGYNDSLFDYVKNRSTDYTDAMRRFISN